MTFKRKEEKQISSPLFQIHHSLALVCGKRIDMHWPGLCLSPLPNNCLRSVIFILIKEDDKKSTNNALSAMQDFGILSMTSNFDNELEILKSRTLIKESHCHV